MRLVLGVSLTASSAVWVLVDTVNGKILAEEVVNLDSVDEIARATARSVQAFDMQTEHDVEGVRMTWSDDASQHGIRLRTKLRLFGFEIVESVSEDAAREGRNKTARHLAPHLALAYGAARADLHADEGRGVLRRLAGRVPIRVAAAVCAVALVGVGLSAFAAMSPSDPVRTAAEATPPQPELPVQPIQPAPPAPAAAPQGVAPQAVSPTEVPVPSAAPQPVAVWQPATTEGQPEVVAAPQDTAEALTDPAVPAAAAAVQATTPTPTGVGVGVPHLPGARPVAGPAQAQPAPAAPRPAPAAPKPVNNLAPPPLPPVLSSLFGALP